MAKTDSKRSLTKKLKALPKIKGKCFQTKISVNKLFQ